MIFKEITDQANWNSVERTREIDQCVRDGLLEKVTFLVFLVKQAKMTFKAEVDNMCRELEARPTVNT